MNAKNKKETSMLPATWRPNNLLPKRYLLLKSEASLIVILSINSKGKGQQKEVSVNDMGRRSCPFLLALLVGKS